MAAFVQYSKDTMHIEIIEQPEDNLLEFLKARIAEFNWQHWEVSERLPLAAKLENERGEVIAGASGRTFGDWLMLEYLWVCDTLRGQGVGEQLLAQMEKAAVKRGCTKAVVDTLNFQARPFYEKHGYVVQWTLQGYPKTGCRHYMVKEGLDLM